MLKCLTLLLMVLFSSFLWGAVNFKNGNFSVSYTDISLTGGGDPLELSRAYNSRSGNLGIFGIGWGTKYETFLEFAVDGSVVIHENGNGAETRFIQRGKSVDAIGSSEKVIAAIKARDKLDDKAAKILQAKIQNDEELRRFYTRKVGLKPDLSISEGTIFENKGQMLQILTRTKEGYVRSYSDGQKDVFNNQGKLIKIINKIGGNIEITYQENNIKSIKDSFAKQLFFEFYPEGRVKSVSGVGTKKAEYIYSGNDLIESRDTANPSNIYKYSYDNKHYLTKITYQDKTSAEMTYDKLNGYVSSVKERDGRITKYKYEDNKNSSWMNYKVSISEMSGKKVDKEAIYLYEYKKDKDGSQRLYHLVETVDGVKVDRVYDEKCQNPTKITSNNITTSFKYNEDCLVVEKNSSTGEFTKLTYDQKWKKINRVEKKSMFSKDLAWTNFSYNDKGELEKAVGSTGQTILLLYNHKGQIYQMVESYPQSKGSPALKNTLSFEYNAQGKPTKIDLEKVGMIKVSYDNDGNILKVDSGGKEDVAVKVSQTFQNLLSIVEIAAVTLSI